MKTRSVYTLSQPLWMLVLAGGAALLLSTGCSSNQPPGPSESTSASPQAATAAPAMAAQAKPYPLDTCIVSGEKLGEMGEPVTLVHAGQEMKFCCKNCVKKFKADPDKYLAELAKKAGTQAAPQPMKMSPGEHQHSEHQH